MNTSANHSSSTANVWRILPALLGAAILVFGARMMTDFLLPPPGVTSKLETSPAPVSDTPATPEAPAPSEQEAALERARQARIAHEKSLAEEARILREQKLQAAMAMRNQSAAEASAEQARMEQAWQNTYRKPKKCDNPYDQTTIVECSNDFIQARQRFEKRWSEGKITAR